MLTFSKVVYIAYCIVLYSISNTYIILFNASSDDFKPSKVANFPKTQSTEPMFHQKLHKQVNITLNIIIVLEKNMALLIT